MNPWQPCRATLADGRERWQFGPIDLVLAADGDAPAVAEARTSAWRRFESVLPELTAELPLLRRPVTDGCVPSGPVARRMFAAAAPFAPTFITPMAAVAGAVAEEIAQHFARPGIRRAWVNNGGDIAFVLAEAESLCVGVVPGLDAPEIEGTLSIRATDPVRGIATSGWRGRSFSLGISDSVTVLAATAAAADAAATLIANAVDADHPAIRRAPANTLKDDSDLEDRLVVTAVGALPLALVDAALARGLACADQFRSRGLIAGAALKLQGRWAGLGKLVPHAALPDPPLARAA
ncbi:MAG: UPF0280 family protein [Burkholderiales bacterium]|nr:UPF0280 family protein [Burkholderiales bacterium]